MQNSWDGVVRASPFGLKQRKRRKHKQEAKTVKRKRAAVAIRESFYSSREWKRLRYEALKLHGTRCQCCGVSSADGARLNVDHIKPRSRFPDLALDLTNLQVLCSWCNAGKGAWDTTDWRQW